jgi:hypothetical protein
VPYSTEKEKAATGVHCPMILPNGKSATTTTTFGEQQKKAKKAPLIVFCAN